MAFRKRNPDDKPERKRFTKDTGNKSSTRKFSDKPKEYKSKFKKPDDGKFGKPEPRSFDKKPGRFSKPERPTYGKSEPRSLDRKPGKFSKGDKPAYGKPESGRFGKDGDRPNRNRKFSSDKPFNKETPDYKREKTDRFPPTRSSSSARDNYKTRGNKFGGSDEKRNTEYDPTKRISKPRFKKTGRYDEKEKPAFETKRTYGEKSYSKDKFVKKDYTGKKQFGRNKREKPEAEEKLETGNTRLNKYVSNAGICSRREADKLIGAGLVSVNGQIITEMGYQVKPGDQVKYNNSKLSTDKKVYLLMNKPKDTITTLDDPGDRKIITDLLKGEDLPRVYPVGRLDRNTTGVLLLTNDGELATRLMHPKYEVQKIYLATLFKNMKGEDLWTLTNGVELEDGFIKPDSIAIPDPARKNEVGVEIHSGRNRIIHRMFESVGYPLEKLDRVLYAGLSRKGLKKGAWRHLDERELKSLKKLVKMR